MITLKNNKGQAGPIGEDLILLIILVLAIAVLLVTLNNLFINHVSMSNQLDSYRVAWVIADKISTDWAYVYYNSTNTRLLNVSKICKNCIPSFSNYNLNYKVNDLRDEMLLCSCGSTLPSTNFTKIIKLPVAIRFSQNKVHPGILEITIWR